MKNFSQLCVWQGVSLGNATEDEFIAEIENLFCCRFEYAEEITTLPGDGGEGGRTDQLFWIHDNHIERFSESRFVLENPVRWWEDVLTNLRSRNALEIYPQNVREKYPETWSLKS